VVLVGLLMIEILCHVVEPSVCPVSLTIE